MWFKVLSYIAVVILIITQPISLSSDITDLIYYLRNPTTEPSIIHRSILRIVMDVYILILCVISLLLRCK